MPDASRRTPEVVIVGGGFGGLFCARALKNAPVNVTLVDRVNYHLFQPLLYQVAMAGLSPAEIAVPIRSVLARQRNARVYLGEAERVDVDNRSVLLSDGPTLIYDHLVLATGSRTNYFGHDDWSQNALGMKTVEDALEIRREVLLAFEAAERTPDPQQRKALLTFVIIGGGPTGVELAGALAELGRRVLARDFRTIRPRETRVVLLEGTHRLLAPFVPPLSEHARRDLESLGVEVRLDTKVQGVEPGVVHLEGESLRAACIIWAAGVRAAPLGESLPFERDRAGRVLVAPDCSVPGHPEISVIGDAASLAGADGKPLPGVAPVAIQQGRAVAKNIARRVVGEPTEAFRYLDKGIMATIGRSRAVLQSGRLRLTGLIAWLGWTFVHILLLIGFRNRLLVLINWSWSYFTYKRGARLIVETPRAARQDTPVARAPRREPERPRVDGR